MRYKTDRVNSDNSIIRKISTRNVGYLSKGYSNGTPSELTASYINHTETEKEDDSSDFTRSLADPENETEYITKEKYELLNRDISYNSIVKSTSTIFCDLDEISKKQSLSLIVEPSLNKEIEEKSKEKSVKHGFGQPFAIVQECETCRGSLLIPRDSTEIIRKRKRTSENDVQFTSQILKKEKRKDQYKLSEIFLKDDNYDDYVENKNSKRYFDRELSGQQKYWSYVKYRTDYTKPIHEEVKVKRKDPCACQLFSYACPCDETNKKSLTALLNRSTPPDSYQTSTADIQPAEKQRIKGQVNDAVKECKVTNTSTEHETILLHSKINKQFKNTSGTERNFNIGSTRKSFKKVRQITCPKCKELIEVVSSTHDGYRKETSSSKPPIHQNIYHQRSPHTSKYGQPSVTNKLLEPKFRKQSYSPNIQRKKMQTAESKDDDDSYCTHNPPCEMIPVCQVLPEHPAKNLSKSAPTKTGPRKIRITKACRHHPPCTVVPSCQRAYVIKNNCEFVPPCKHRPRCINLPICVPISKTYNLDRLTANQDTTNEGRTQRESPQDPSNSNEVIRQYCDVYQLQKTCEHGTRHVQQTLRQTRNMSPGTISAQCHITTPTLDIKHIESVACQYDVRQIVSDEVVFIRDAGCQFKNKINFPKDDSLARLLTPSVSFELMNVKMENNYSGSHSLRYEDKCTRLDSDLRSYDISSDSDRSTELSAFASPRFRRRIAGSICGNGYPTRPSTYMAALSTCHVNNSYSRKLSISKEKIHAKNRLLGQGSHVKSNKSNLNRTPSKRYLKSHHRRCRRPHPANSRDSGNGEC